MNFRYQAYGLVLESPFEFPSLPITASDPDVCVVLDQAYVIPPYVVLSPRDYVRNLPESNSAIFAFQDEEDGAVISVENGEIIRIKPVPRVNEELLAQVLLSIPMRLLLHQRGLFVFHASAVIINGKSVAFCGQSRQGKSTLAAHLQARGYPFITDDSLAAQINKNGSIYLFTAPPQIRLLPDALASIGERAENTNPYYDKHLFQGLSTIDYSPPPLARLYILETTTSEDTHIEAIPPVEAIQQVFTHSFVGELTQAKKEVFKDPQARIEHLKKCAIITQQVPLRRLVRRRDFSEMPKLIDMIVRDVEG